MSEEEKIRKACARVCDEAWKEYLRVRDRAWEEFDRVCDPAREEYERVRDRAVRVRDVQLAKLQKVKL